MPGRGYPTPLFIHLQALPPNGRAQLPGKGAHGKGGVGSLHTRLRLPNVFDFGRLTPASMKGELQLLIPLGEAQVKGGLGPFTNLPFEA
jgi:hypothetical protein